MNSIATVPLNVGAAQQRAGRPPAALHFACLSQHPQSLPVIAGWHHQHWRDSGCATSISERQSKLQTHLHSAELPTTRLAFAGSELAGSVSLVNYALLSATIDSAWVANLFVTAAQRRRGIGTALLQHAIEIGASLGLKKLYLFTPELKRYYQDRGWFWRQQQRVRGQWVDILEYPLVL